MQATFTKNAEFLGHPQMRFWQLIPFFFFLDTGKYTENLENVNTEQIIFTKCHFQNKSCRKSVPSYSVWF